MSDLPPISDSVMVAALCALAEKGVRPDTQGALMTGTDGPTAIEPGALRLAISRAIRAHQIEERQNAD